MRAAVRMILFLVNLGFFLPSLAAETKPQPKTMEQKVLDGAAGISKQIDKAAESIDITLAGKKYTRKRNTSSANVSHLVTWTEGGNISQSTDFGIDLRLPNLERRWQLRFSSYNEEEENRDLTQRRVRTRPRERDPGAALMFFEKLGKVRTLFQPRLELTDPLEVSYILRFESDATFKKLRVAPKLELFADPQKGTGEYASLDFIWEISKRLEFALQNSEEYRDYENFFSTQHGISIDYSLAPTRAIGSTLSAGSINRPDFHLDNLTYSIAYTEHLYKGLFRYSLSPFVTFRKSLSFKGFAGLSLNLEVVF